jgi:hypothetical protein
MQNESETPPGERSGEFHLHETQVPHVSCEVGQGSYGQEENKSAVLVHGDSPAHILTRIPAAAAQFTLTIAVIDLSMSVIAMLRQLSTGLRA